MAYARTSPSDVSSAGVEAFPDVRTLIPHQGPSCLLDGVISSAPAGVECRASVPVEHPYRTSVGVHPLLAIELFAQAAAVHSALSRGSGSAQVASGHLAGADVKIHGDPLQPPSTLLVRVTSGATFGSLTRFAGELYLDGHERVLVATGEISVASGPGSSGVPGEANP